MVAEYKARGELVVKGLATIPNLETMAPHGAFYAFPRCVAYFGSRAPDGTVIANDTELAAYLLRSAKVAMVPGIAFGLASYIRLSFATSRATLIGALDRVNAALAVLQRNNVSPAGEKSSSH